MVRDNLGMVMILFLDDEFVCGLWSKYLSRCSFVLLDGDVFYLDVVFGVG